MKKLVWMMIVAAATLTAYAQGNVTMNSVGTGAYMRFFDTGTRALAVGNAYNVGLYWGDSAATVNNLSWPGGAFRYWRVCWHGDHNEWWWS